MLLFWLLAEAEAAAAALVVLVVVVCRISRYRVICWYCSSRRKEVTELDSTGRGTFELLRRLEEEEECWWW